MAFLFIHHNFATGDWHLTMTGHQYGLFRAKTLQIAIDPRKIDAGARVE